MWKPIPEFPRYLINEYGDVKSLHYKKLLKHSIHPNGWHKVNLQNKSGRYTMYIHRLVAQTYLEIDDDAVVTHKDGNRSNNHVSNLKIINRPKTTETISDGFQNKYCLTDDEIRDIVSLSKRYSDGEIARQYRIPPAEIRKVVYYAKR